MNSSALPALACILVAGAACLGMYAGTRLLARVRLVWSLVLPLAGLAVVLVMLVGHSASIPLTGALVAGIGLFGGEMTGRHIASRTALSVAMVAAALADCASFLFGPTHFALREAAGVGATPLATYLAISVPMGGHVCSVIGVGDLWIVATCAAATRRLRWPEWAIASAPLMGILAAVGVALTCGPLPALPFLAGAMLAFLAAPALKERARAG